jgi:small conductance mechanosensitive channel
MSQETQVQQYIHQFTNIILSYIPNVIKAVLILVVGIVIIKILRRVITGLMTKTADHDPTLLKFVLDVATWILRAFIFVAVIGALGVETTTFAAAIGAAGIAIGLSLQGSLSNFAGGLLIILFKPFRVGDYIEAQGLGGTVNSIQIFSTRIITPNNQVIYMPNGTLSNNTIKNYSQEPLRRAEIIIGVSYNSDLKHVKNILFDVIRGNDKILTEPAPGIEVKELAESSVNLIVFIWSERGDFGKMVSDFYEDTKAAFEKEGIELPFPQRDIHLKSKDKTN